MNLKVYVANLQQVLKANPKYGDLTVITSIDSEGNGFNEVYFDPSVGQFEDRDFIGESEFEEYNEDFGEPCKVNAICVN